MTRPKHDISVIEELAAIKELYKLSYKRLEKEMAEVVGISIVTIFRMLRDGEGQQSTKTAIDVWFNKVGRRKYPL